MNFVEIPGYGKVLKCPVCSFEYTHLKEVQKTNHDGRSGVTLEFMCEEGHSFFFNLYNHKGYTICDKGNE
jgi:hypothetical protein